MHVTDLGTIVRADARSFVWGWSGPWPEVVEQLVRHVRQAVHAEMGKPAAEAPKAILILPPQVTHLTPDAKRYAVESEVIRDPKPSETQRPGAVLFQLDADAATRNLTITKQLSEIEARLRRTPPPSQPGPIT